MNKILNFIILFLFLFNKLILAKADLSPVENLVENGEVVRIRGYYEAPESYVFLISDILLARPTKLIEYKDSLASVFGDWNITEILNNLSTSIIYGNLTQQIKNDNIDAEANLYRFLSQIDEYVSPTIAKFDIPLYMREKIDLPLILECDFIKHRMNEARLNFFLNFENHSPFEISESEQLICILKGNLTMVLLRPEEYEKFLAFELNSEENDIKKIKHSIGQLEKGQCFYIPAKTYYATQAENVWFYSLSWAFSDQILNVTDCGSKDSKTKISNLAFKKDFNSANQETKIGFLSYFLLYLDPNQKEGINKNDFIEKVKTDETIMRSIQVCDNQCPFILSKIFGELDTDKNLMFSLNDILNLDYKGALILNSKVEKHIQDLGQSLLSQVENLKKSFQQLKNLAEQHGMTDQVMGLLKQKLNEWKNSLSEEEKQKYGEVQMDLLFEKLFDFSGGSNKRNERAERRDEARKNAGNKRNDIKDEKAPESFLNIDENEEAEISAEDDDDDQNRQEL